MKIYNWIKLILAIIICNLAGFIGSLFTVNSISTWYATLNKPDFSPPNWLFGPAWGILYILMGISLYLVWMKGVNKVKNSLIIFGIQLLLNALWSIIFFGMRNITFAFIEIILIWIFILLTIIEFYKIDKRASYLLIPYILWVSFATVLNFYILILN